VVPAAAGTVPLPIPKFQIMVDVVTPMTPFGAWEPLVSHDQGSPIQVTLVRQHAQDFPHGRFVEPAPEGAVQPLTHAFESQTLHHDGVEREHERRGEHVRIVGFRPLGGGPFFGQPVLHRALPVARSHGDLLGWRPGGTRGQGHRLLRTTPVPLIGGLEPHARFTLPVAGFASQLALGPLRPLEVFGMPIRSQRIRVPPAQPIAAGSHRAIGNTHVQRDDPGGVEQTQTRPKLPWSLIEHRVTFPIQALGPVLRMVFFDRQQAGAPVLLVVCDSVHAIHAQSCLVLFQDPTMMMQSRLALEAAMHSVTFTWNKLLEATAAAIRAPVQSLAA
jgi:hypothetical protein